MNEKKMKYDDIGNAKNRITRLFSDLGFTVRFVFSPTPFNDLFNLHA
jgi:hypothetical protein